MNLLVALSAVGMTGLCGSSFAQDFVPGSNYWHLPGAWDAVQIDPDYYATGLQTMIWEFPWGSAPYDITTYPPRNYYWRPQPDEVSTRRHTVSVTLKNVTSCHASSEPAEFNAIDSATSTVSTTRSTGWTATGVLTWAAPLVEDIRLMVAYTSTSSTTWAYSNTVTLTAVVRNSYLVDPCRQRLAYLVIEETKRRRGSDNFTGGRLHLVGWMRDASGNVLFDRPHWVGRGLDRVDGTAVWITNLDTEAESQTWITGCELNCGGVSDGDIDNDGIPDANDPDMDGDGIANNHDNDIDGDGIPNDSDPDDDNDGILDGDDDFNGPPGSDDIDGDGISNEDDLDIDGDGIPNEFETGDEDDLDGDGVPNKDDGDIDGDGVPNEEDDTPYGRIPTLDVWIDGEWRRVPLLR